MPRRDPRVEAAVRYLADHQDGVITLRQAQECGMPASTVIDRAARGHWRRLLPGVYAAYSGPTSEASLFRAGLLYAGPESMLTGLSTLAGLPGVRTPSDPRVHLLVPSRLGVSSRAFVVVERTTRLPEQPTLAAGFPAAPIPRAVIDAGRRMRVPRAVNALVTSVVQRELCTTDELERELRGGQRRGSRLLRLAIADAAAGTRSVAESDARSAVIAAGLPEPLWNPVIEDVTTGAFIAQPDGYYQDLGVALEVDSRAHHTIGDDFDRTLDRDALLTSYGILVIHATPASIRRNPRAYADRIARTLAVAQGRPLPAVRVRRAA